MKCSSSRRLTLIASSCSLRDGCGALSSLRTVIPLRACSRKRWTVRREIPVEHDISFADISSSDIWRTTCRRSLEKGRPLGMVEVNSCQRPWYHTGLQPCSHTYRRYLTAQIASILQSFILWGCLGMHKVSRRYHFHISSNFRQHLEAPIPTIPNIYFLFICDNVGRCQRLPENFMCGGRWRQLERK